MIVAPLPRLDQEKPLMLKPIAFAALLFWLASGAPALALDCAAAKTAQDKAICADPAAHAADAAMTKAYSTLFQRLSEPDRKALLLSQRAWLKAKTYGCPDAGGALAQCLARKSIERQRFLEGMPETGPGSGGRLVPVFIEQAGRKGSYEIDVTALKYAPPISAGEKRLNTEVDKLLKKVPGGKNDAYGRDMIYAFILHMRMAYAGPRFLSAHIDMYQFAGGAHGNSGARNINIDVAKGSILHFVDVFPAAAKAKLDAECLRQILPQKAERRPDEKMVGDNLTHLQKGIAEGLGKLDSWSFSTQGARVTYDAYALGAYVEGSYRCQFPSAFLRPLVKSGFPLP